MKKRLIKSPASSGMRYVIDDTGNKHPQRTKEQKAREAERNSSAKVASAVANA